MFSKVVVLCALVAVSQAGLLAAPAYSSAAAVSSQNIVRHDQPAVAVAAPVAYHAAPAVAYHAAPTVAYQAAPAVAYQAAPARYSSAAAVSSQNIIRHDEPAVAAPVATYRAAPAVAAPVETYRAAPAVAAYTAPAVATYRAAPAVTTVHAAPAVAAYAAPAVASYRTAPAATTVHAAPAVATYHAAPAVATYAAPAIAYRAAEVDAHPRYEYTYSVADSHTGDNKSQQESRDGDVVRGSYSFHEADGSVRTVEYSADDHSGFNAVVHNTAPTAAPAHPVVRPVAAAYYH